MTRGGDSPRMLGRYELLYLLGQGGMGEVHLSKLSGAAGFEKLSIVKTILPHMQGDPQFIDRFRHEAGVLVHLTHSNIAQVLDMGDADGTLYMAIEYVSGVDLARVASRTARAGAQVPVSMALFVGQRLSEALGYAHRKTSPEGAPLGIVHRDVSPHNVMVSYEGEVKVIDFGLAKSAARSKHTLPSTVMGKLGYMSPEQAMALPLDHRSDIYSAGIVVWELLAGRSLFDGGTMAEMVVKMAQPTIPPLRELRAEISPALEQVVLRALAVDPAARYSRADDFARALNELAVREQLAVGAEDVGNYVRAMCPEEFAAERALQSKLSVLRRRGSAPVSVAPPEIEGTVLRPSSAGATSGEMTPAQRALSLAQGAHEVEAGRQATPAPATSSAARASLAPPAVEQAEVPSVPIAVPRSRTPWFIVAGVGVVGVVVVVAALWPGKAPPTAPASPSPAPVVARPVEAPSAPTAERVPEAVAPGGASTPQPIGTVKIIGPVLPVRRSGEELVVMLKEGQTLKKGDPLDLIGDPAGARTAPMYAEGVVLSVVGSVATIGLYDASPLPPSLFAMKDAARVPGTRERAPGVGAPRATPSAPAPVAPGSTEAARAPEPAPAAQPAPVPVIAAQPVVPAMVPDNPFEKTKTPGGRVEPTRLEPTRVEPAAQVAPAVQPAQAPQVPGRPIRGTVQLYGPRSGGMLRFTNQGSFSVTNCRLRLPGGRLSAFSREIYAGASVDVPYEALTPDKNAPDPQMDKGWAPIYCAEGSGYLQVLDYR
jgi:serine/threonine protein kinase